MTPRQINAKCRDLDARLHRQEWLTRELAHRLGLSVAELEAERSPGVRFDLPSTYAEWVTWCRLNEVDDDQ